MRRCNWIINTLIKAISGRSSYSYTQTSASAQYDLIMIEDSTTTTTPPSPNNIWPLFCQVQLMCVCSFLRLAVVIAIIEIIPLMKINSNPFSDFFLKKNTAGWLACLVGFANLLGILMTNLEYLKKRIILHLCPVQYFNKQKHV